MSNLTSSKKKRLTMTSKEEDCVVCESCGEGIYIPLNPNAEINHAFTCNKCGDRFHFEANVIVE